MNTVASEGASVRAQARPAARTSALRFDALATALGVWMVSGLYLDGWAHTHGRVDQSVFTPWHGVLYSGFLALGGLFAVTYLRNRSAGLAARDAMPAGYGLSLVGVLLFLAGGLGDTGWHMTLGIEIGVDALYSPTHLVLAAGGVLMISGPIRAAWHRGAAAGWPVNLPLVLSLTGTFSVLTFFTQVMHPLSQRAAEGTQPADGALFFFLQSMGVAGVVLTSMLLVGLSLLTMRRATLPLGTFTLLFGVNAWAMSFLTDGFPGGLIVGAALAGALADLLARRMAGDADWAAQAQVFGFVVPAAYFLFYFLVLLIGPGVWWTVHLWMGTPVLAGIAGWMVAYAISSGDSYRRV